MKEGTEDPALAPGPPVLDVDVPARGAWTRFPKRTHGGGFEPWVAVYSTGTFRLSAAAHELMGRPEAVDLLFSGGLGRGIAGPNPRRCLGMRPADPDDPDAYLVRRYQGTGWQISAKSFCHALGVPPGRFPARLEDGVLVFRVEPGEEG